MRERRSDPRAPITVTTYLARRMADGSAAVMELRSADLSAGGLHGGFGGAEVIEDPGEGFDGV